ncbi:MAG: ATP-binding cassette domain-containing protein [Ruminococcus sp.]|nr:ATP-binding cassette domain-containing protein [Ruminococcus sp.]
MSYIMTTTNLTKTYGKKDAAKDVSIHVREGEIYGLIGRNGAGKTTVMRMISGLSKPTSGSYQLNGENKFGVGVLIESPGIYPNMSAAENLRLKCIAMGCYSKKYVDDLLLTVGLENAGKKNAGSFSLGMRQRLGIALALVGDPKMIVLDEPINGLDPQGIVEVRHTLEKLKEEKNITIMISSHILDELSKLADSYGIIHEGKLLDEFTTEELSSRCGQFVIIKTTDNRKAVALINKMDELTNGEVIASIDDDGNVRVVDVLDKTIEINKALMENNIGVKEIFIQRTSLEDYYLSVTGGDHNG